MNVLSLYIYIYIYRYIYKIQGSKLISLNIANNVNASKELIRKIDLRDKKYNIPFF